MNDHQARTYDIQYIKTDQRDPDYVDNTVQEMINVFCTSSIFILYNRNDDKNEETDDEEKDGDDKEFVWKAREPKYDSNKDNDSINSNNISSNESSNEANKDSNRKNSGNKKEEKKRNDNRKDYNKGDNTKRMKEIRKVEKDSRRLKASYFGFIWNIDRQRV